MMAVFITTVETSLLNFLVTISSPFVFERAVLNTLKTKKAALHEIYRTYILSAARLSPNHARIENRCPEILSFPCSPTAHRPFPLMKGIRRPTLADGLAFSRKQNQNLQSVCFEITDYTNNALLHYYLFHLLLFRFNTSSLCLMLKWSSFIFRIQNKRKYKYNTV